MNIKNKLKELKKEQDGVEFELELSSNGLAITSFIAYRLRKKKKLLENNIQLLHSHLYPKIIA